MSQWTPPPDTLQLQDMVRPQDTGTLRGTPISRYGPNARLSTTRHSALATRDSRPVLY